MTQTHNPQSGPQGPSVHRSVDDRMLAGVAGGLAAHLRINPWWIRWAFIILSFFGGTGALLYIAAWLLIPDAYEEETAVSRWLSSVDLTDAGSVFGIVLIGAGAVVLGSQVLNISGAFIAAAIMFVVGLMLYRGDLRPRSKEPAPSMPPIPPDDTDLVADSGSTDQPLSDGAETIVSSGVDTEGDQIPVAAGVAAATTQAVPQGSPPPPPPPKPPRPPRPPRERSMLGRLTLAVGLIILSTMALLDVSNVTIGNERTGDLFDPIHYVAVALAVVAVGLLVGAFVGRARWLIFVGIFILPVIVVTSLWSSVFSWTAGEYVYAPTSVTEVDSRYELGAGQLIVDLSSLSAAELAEVGRVEAKLGLGELKIIVPAGVGVLLDASVGLGDIDVPGPDREGIGPSMNRQFGPSPIVLFIDAEVGAGAINLTVQEFAGSSS